MLNKVILIGRLTKDPELRNTTTGRAVCQITVAVNRTFTNQNGEREADFINCVVWDKQAENVAKYLTKGRLVSVEGRLQTRNYDDKDGKKVYVTEVVAGSVQFLEPKGSSTPNNNYANNSYTNNNNQNDLPFDNGVTETISVEKDPFEAFGEITAVNDNDLPF